MTNKEKSKDVAVVVEKQLPPLVKIAEAMKIEKPEDMEGATEVLSQLNQIHDKIEEEKEKVTKPANAILKAERARWKPAETLYEKAISLLRGKMSAYQTAKLRAEKEEEAKIAARVGSGKGKLKVETAVEKMENIDRVDKKVVTESGLVKFRTDKVLKITDESKIPRKFLLVDEKAVKEALLKGEKVDGAEIEEVQTPINFR